jgi:dephospho-CoA kinase
MPAIGITGGVATGKSTFTQCLKELLTEGNEPGSFLQKITPKAFASGAKETKGGSSKVPSAKFFDADVAAREVLDLPEVKEKLTAEFGEKIFSGPGHLNREALRAIVFADAAKMRALEQILHPPIRQQWQATAETHRHSTDFFFADIPLLDETGGEKLCDRVVVVACSRKIQLARLLERTSAMEGRAPASPASQELRPPDREHLFEQIIKSQMPLEEKIKKADHVVWNNGDEAGPMEQARLLVAPWRP